MYKNFIFLFTIITLSVLELNAQKNIYLNIAHKLGEKEFALNQIAQNDMGQDFQFTRVSYYISSVKVIHDGGIVTDIPDKYILVSDSREVSELLGSYDFSNVEGVSFAIGVDSSVNNGDPALWEPFHPLAPKSPSMHWGWTAGYRFVAVEGKAGNNFNTVFQMHGIWNYNYFSQTIMVNGENLGNDIFINLDADYVKAVNGINLNAGPYDHGVNATDLDVMHNFRDHVFSPSAGASSSGEVKTLDKYLEVYPNPGYCHFTIKQLSGQHHVSRIDVRDLRGKLIYSTELILPYSSLELPVSGAYLISAYNKDAYLGSTLILNQ